MIKRIHCLRLKPFLKVNQPFHICSNLQRRTVTKKVNSSLTMTEVKAQGQTGHGSTNGKETKFYKVKKNSDNCDIIENLVGILQKGGVIALPTDTLYGIACLAQSTQAIEKVYKIKGRDVSKPIAICVGEVYDVFHWGKFPLISDPALEGKGDSATKRPIKLISELFPGPVTLVTERTPALNMDLNPETQLVGLRVPDSQFIRDLVNRLKEPLALTSANLSATASSLCVEDFENLHHRLDAVVDGGHLGVISGVNNSRKGSTVVRIMQDGKSFKVLRAGCALQPTVHVLQDKWGFKMV